MEKTKEKYCIGFYNLENLFDTKNDPKTLDDDFTENAERNWNRRKYQKKIKKLGKVISKIGKKEVGYAPAILGVAEVENSFVLQDLIQTKYLRKKGYHFIHFDSPDERGIDTALLYRKGIFSVTEKKVFPLLVTNEKGERDYTRDILYVKGLLNGIELYILVNHWPSRRSGADLTEEKRIKAAQKNLEIIAEIKAKNQEAKIIVLGDFNDNPQDKSIQLLIEGGLYNPLNILLTQEMGSLTHKNEWYLFDQVLFSHNFLNTYQNNFVFDYANIYNPQFIKEYKGKYKGNPFRTFIGTKYLGGYSDHFPVYSIFYANN